MINNVYIESLQTLSFISSFLYLPTLLSIFHHILLSIIHSLFFSNPLHFIYYHVCLFCFHLLFSLCISNYYCILNYHKIFTDLATFLLLNFSQATIKPKFQPLQFRYFRSIGLSYETTGVTFRLSSTVISQTYWKMIA